MDIPVAEAELDGARVFVPVAAGVPVALRKFDLMHALWQAAYAAVSSALPLPWSHFMAH